MPIAVWTQRFEIDSTTGAVAPGAVAPPVVLASPLIGYRQQMGPHVGLAVDSTGNLHQMLLYNA